MYNLKDEINQALKSRIQEEGFTKKGNCYCRQSETQGYQDLISFSQYSYSSGRAVGVVVGIRCLAVERLYELLTGCSLKAPMSVVNVNIGYLEPDKHFKDWYFENSANLDGIVEGIFDEIRKYAYPFFSEYEDATRLADALERREFVIVNEQRFYILPLLYLVSGRKEKGIACMNDMCLSGFSLDENKKEFMQNYIEH